MGVIETIELRLIDGKLRIVAVPQLRIVHLADQVADRHSRSDFPLILFTQRHIFDAAIRHMKYNMPVFFIVPIGLIGRRLRRFHGERQRLRKRRIYAARNCCKARPKLIGDAFNTGDVARSKADARRISIGSLHHAQIPEHILRVLDKVTVDVIGHNLFFPALIDLPFNDCAMNPIGHFGVRSEFFFTLTKNEKICANVRPGASEKRIGEANRSDKLALARKLSPKRIVFLIHRPVARDGDNKTSGTYFVHHFQKKIVVDEIVLVVSGIGDDAVSKRDVGDRQIKCPRRESRMFKAVCDDLCALCCMACDLGG